VLSSEAFFADPGAGVRRVAAFAGVREWQPTRFEKFQAGEYSGLEPKLRERLVDYFRPHNARLRELLGVDFGWETAAAAR
jgi:hypothetical protein